MSNTVKYFVAFVVLVQLLTLNLPALNGDEAIYMLIIEEIQKLLSGHIPTLNPIVSYMGPLDFWLLGSVYALFYHFDSIAAGPWMLRIIPFAMTWIGFFILYREINRWSRNTGLWFLFFAAITPVVMVFSRVAFPHPMLIGTISILLSEALRVKRGERPRLLFIAFIVGFSIECHSSAFLGIFASLVPITREIFIEIRRRKLLAAISVFLLLILAYPVIRNFPPPVSDGLSNGLRLHIQFRSLLNILAGYQSFKFWMGGDPAPIFLRLAFLGAMAYFPISLLISIFRAPDWKKDQLRLPFVITHFIAFILAVISCARGRSLETAGYERYLLFLAPGFLLAQAIGFSHLITYRRAFIGTAIILAIFSTARFAVPLVEIWKNPDNNYEIAKWLTKTCPADSCVAYAENFWDYWPLRYYSKDKVNVNCYHFCEKPVVHHALPVGGKAVGCWYDDSKVMFKGKFEKINTFAASRANKGRICFEGISL